MNKTYALARNGRIISTGMTYVDVKIRQAILRAHYPGDKFTIYQEL